MNRQVIERRQYEICLLVRPSERSVLNVAGAVLEVVVLKNLARMPSGPIHRLVLGCLIVPLPLMAGGAVAKDVTSSSSATSGGRTQPKAATKNTLPSASPAAATPSSTSLVADGLAPGDAAGLKERGFTITRDVKGIGGRSLYVLTPPPGVSPDRAIQIIQEWRPSAVVDKNSFYRVDDCAIDAPPCEPND
jgi:hypothetical protein